MATQQPGDEQVRQRLDSSITGLDDLRTENLKRTQLLQTIKDKSLKKEQVRLEIRRGPVGIVNAGDLFVRQALYLARTECDLHRVRVLFKDFASGDRIPADEFDLVTAYGSRRPEQHAHPRRQNRRRSHRDHSLPPHCWCNSLYFLASSRP